MGVEAYDVAAELSDLSQVETMMNEIEKRGKPVDILFNDAAVQIAYRTDYYKTPAEDYTKSFVINTIAPMMLCYRFIPKMIERGWELKILQGSLWKTQLRKQQPTNSCLDRNKLSS